MTDLQRTQLDKAIWVDPQRMSGAPCFRDTRVPVQSLIDLLEGGETIDTFLSLYPSITRQQVVAVLDFAVRETERTRDKLLADAMAGYVAEFAETREMLNSRYDDLKSGKVKPTDGEAFFESLRKREDELLNKQ